MAETGSLHRPTRRDYLICYALYILLIALGVVVVFGVLRIAILALLAAFLQRSQANRLIYLASMTLLGLGLFILVMGAEPYLRNGVERDQLRRRFFRLAWPLLIAGAVGLLVRAAVLIGLGV